MKDLSTLEKSQKREWEQGISHMFCEIAETYEKINTFISMGMDEGWRRKLLNRVKDNWQDAPILDIGCGPGSLSKLSKKEFKDFEFISTDISLGMLEIAGSSGNADRVACVSGSALPFADNTFAAVTSSFVLRNLPDLDLFYSECQRVLKKDGVVSMLDLTQPKFRPITFFHGLYMKAALPLGAKIYGSRLEAYEYLDRSIHNCVDPDEMNKKLEKAGFEVLHTDRLCMGTVTIYTAKVKK